MPATWSRNELDELLRNTFGTEYATLATMERATLRDDIRDMEITEGLGTPLACRTLYRRIGGAANLPSYVDSLTAPYR